VTDLDNGAIFDADILPGDQHDTDELAARVFTAEDHINAALGNEPDTALVAGVTADKGYFEVSDIEELQRENVATVISDPIGDRRMDRLSAEMRASVERARRATRSKRDKALLKRCGKYLVRSLAQILHHGAALTTTLSGRTKSAKRFQIAAMAGNVALLMRHLHGTGTPRQAVALAKRRTKTLRNGICHSFQAITRLLLRTLVIAEPLKALTSR